MVLASETMFTSSILRRLISWQWRVYSVVGIRALTMWEQESQIPCEMFSIQFNVSRAGSFHTELSTGDQEIHPRYGLTVISFRGNSAGSPVIQTWMKLRPLRGFGIALTLWVLMDTATCQAEATLDRVCAFCTN
jgi:hypothetical protein